MTDDATGLETFRLATEDGVVAYDDTGGEGPLVLAIPGMGDLRSQYRWLRPCLRKAGYRVVTMDVRGFGDSSVCWIDYSARAVGRDALALLRHLGQEPAVILGNSFAAGSALWAAHDAPTAVRAVVLLGPIVRDPKLSRLTRVALAAGFAGPWRTWFWLTYWNSLFPHHKPADHAATKAALRRNLGEAGRMGVLRAMIGLSKADTAALLPRSEVPALVIMGSRDPDFADATQEAHWLAATIGADSMVIDGIGHYPHVECPEEVAARIVSFVQKTP